MGDPVRNALHHPNPQPTSRNPRPTPPNNVNVTYACPACDQGVRNHFDAATKELSCPHCQGKIALPAEAVEGDRVKRCLVCPSTDLFVRKDFPQRLGVALVVIGIIGSSIAWYYSDVFWTFAILFTTALIDVGPTMPTGGWTAHVSTRSPGWRLRILTVVSAVSRSP